MDDVISRRVAISLPVKPKEDRYFQTQNLDDAYDYGWSDLQRCIEKLPSAQPEQQSIIDIAKVTMAMAEKADLVAVTRCKDCKHFHYDMPYVVQGIPILGHEVCDFWGDGCKTNENGFCSFAERKGSGGEG